MKKISAPAIEQHLREGTLQKQFRQIRTEALSFADEVCSVSHEQQEFFECTFTQITFAGRMDSCLFADCRFDHCDFSNADFSESVFRRCQLNVCRMTGTDFSECRFQDVSMQGCEASYSSWFGSRWKLCSWKEMAFSHSSFSECTFDDVRITGCSFAGAEFLHSRLKGMDFSDSDISSVAVGISEVKGAIMNEEQAAACVSLLGIIVRRR